LRRGIEMMQQQPTDARVNTSSRHTTTDPQARINRRFDGGNNGSMLNGSSGITPRNSLIRRPAQIFVDADSEK
jgi:hypothetical protein